MRKCFLIIALITIVGSVNAQKEKIIGSWLVTEAEIDGKIQYPYQTASFTKDGKMIIMDVDVGTWKYNKKINAIEKESDFDKDFDGTDKILKLSNKELIVENNGVKVTYLKLDENKIAIANKKSGFIGSWELGNINSTITFNEPDQFTFIQKEEYQESTVNGKWIFDEYKKSLILIGFRSDRLLAGECKVNLINDLIFEIEKNSKTVSAIKKEEPVENTESTLNLDKLSFTEDDFFAEDGNYKYNNESEKLPWRDLHMVLDQLADFDHLIYSFDTLNEETNSLENKLLKADVFVNVKNQRLKIDNIFYGFDRYTTPDEVEFQENDENGDSDLYPLNENMYRVVGQEELSINNEVVNCTVVEALNSNDELLKIWFMNDKPAIIAKLIKTSEYPTHYSIYKLKEINYK